MFQRRGRNGIRATASGPPAPNSFLATFTGNNPGNPQNNNRMDGYSYDSAGNLLNDGSHVYTYDAENRVTRVNLPGPGGALIGTYVYDADGQRVQKTTTTGNFNDPAGTWQFLYDQSGHMIQRYDGTFWQGNVFAGGRHLATVGGGTYFRHSDWLGTERFQTVYQFINDPWYYTYCTSLPFGDALTCHGGSGNSGGSDISPLHFTGKERDSESGLDYFGARHHGSGIGRFISQDPGNAGAKLSAPQSWNLYSYVANNPVNAIDPDGLCSYHFADGWSAGDIPLDSFPGACGGGPAQPPTLPAKKLSIQSTDFYDPSMPGSVTGNSQPNLPAMKFQGPGGSVIGGYGGFNIFGALHCAAENDPSDPACWGVKLTLKGGTFQWSWSIDAYAMALEKSVNNAPSPTGQLKPSVPVPDPLDPSSQLIGLTLTPIPLPTARSYICPAIQRQLAIQTGNSQQVAALQTVYQKSCQ